MTVDNWNPDQQLPITRISEVCVTDDAPLAFAICGLCGALIAMDSQESADSHRLFHAALARAAIGADDDGSI